MKRQSKMLPASLEHRLSGYALAASAAGVGMLGVLSPVEFLVPSGVAVASLFSLSESAQAKIVYTPTNVRVTYSGYDLDLNHDGVVDFGLFVSASCTTGGCFGSWLFITDRRRNRVLVTESSFASALMRGAHIGRKDKFSLRNRATPMVTCPTIGCSTSHIRGPWRNVNNRYLGLKFVIHRKLHYGWARLNVSLEQGIHGTLTGYAYETIANKPIIAGKTKGKDVITVKSASLGHLARGASALPAWRKESADVSH